MKNFELVTGLSAEQNLSDHELIHLLDSDRYDERCLYKRLMFPYALIPATTALGAIHPKGREPGLKAGANVVMLNLSPIRVRKLYALYENKICTGEEAAQCRGCPERRVNSVGYHIVTARGDVKKGAGT